MNHVLVACFSATGVTLEAAKIIAAATGGELFRIVPVKPYTSEDLNWNDSASRTSVEKRNPGTRPEIADTVKNMADFGTVFLGFPIWWYVAPRIIHTFLDSYDFSGKKIYPFATSGGSGLGKIPQNLREEYPAADWRQGTCFPGHPSRAKVETWLKELNLK